jgi:hypothetical protein
VTLRVPLSATFRPAAELPSPRVGKGDLCGETGRLRDVIPAGFLQLLKSRVEIVSPLVGFDLGTRLGQAEMADFTNDPCEFFQLLVRRIPQLVEIRTHPEHLVGEVIRKVVDDRKNESKLLPH